MCLRLFGLLLFPIYRAFLYGIADAAFCDTDLLCRCSQRIALVKKFLYLAFSLSVKLIGVAIAFLIDDQVRLSDTS